MVRWEIMPRSFSASAAYMKYKCVHIIAKLGDDNGTLVAIKPLMVATSI